MTEAIEELIDLSEDLSFLVLTSQDGGGLEMLRSIPGVSVHARGNRISVTGCKEGIKKIKRFFKVLSRRLAARDELHPQEIRHIFSEFVQGNENGKDDPFEEIISTHSGRIIRPKTFNQQTFIEAIKSREITIAVGPAGTGKTYLAVAMGVQALREKMVSRLILSRPTIEAGEKLGFLPGDLMEKVDPHFRPLYDALQDFLGISRFQQLLRQGIIEITPLGYSRGRTFNEAFIILDEAQNTTLRQMKMFLTRLGYGSRMVITGDRTQVDLPNPQDSSLSTLQNILKAIERIAFIYFNERDVVRHDLVREIIKAYENFLEGSENKT